jgi:hypothetical protein
MSEFERKITRVTIEKGRVVINGNAVDAAQEAEMRQRMADEQRVWDYTQDKAPRRMPSFMRRPRKIQ